MNTVKKPNMLIKFMSKNQKLQFSMSAIMECDHCILSNFNMFFLTVGKEIQDKVRPYLESNEQ